MSNEESAPAQTDAFTRYYNKNKERDNVLATIKSGEGLVQGIDREIKRLSIEEGLYEVHDGDMPPQFFNVHNYDGNGGKGFRVDPAVHRGTIKLNQPAPPVQVALSNFKGLAEMAAREAGGTVHRVPVLEREPKVLDPEDTWIDLPDGQRFYPHHPERLKRITLRQLADGQASCRRWTLANKALNVIEHVNYVVWTLRQLGCTDTRVLYYAAFHDAAEAVFRDLPRTLKYLPGMETFVHVERLLLAQIFQWYRVTDWKKLAIFQIAHMLVTAEEGRQNGTPPENWCDSERMEYDACMSTATSVYNTLGTTIRDLESELSQHMSRLNCPHTAASLWIGSVQELQRSLCRDLVDPTDC